MVNKSRNQNLTLNYGVTAPGKQITKLSLSSSILVPEFYVTGSDNFFVNQNLDVRGKIINSTGDLILSSSVTTSGSFKSTELIYANKGITFPSAQVPSANVNTLDDYEEGTFTPEFRDISGNILSAANHRYQVGNYIKIGRLVQINLRIGIETTTYAPMIGTKAIIIYGLPFVSENAGVYSSITVGYGLGLAIAAGNVPCGYVKVNSTSIILHNWDTSVGISSLLVQEVSTGGELMISATYLAAA